MSNRSSRAPPPPRAAPGARSVRFNMEGGEKLKNIGNELFKQGKHVEAIAKYTESANAYPMNPVVYANRAAAHLATKEYIDAVFDCEKATKLDPTYAKAWARLGTALYELSSWDECSNAWNKALEHLSKPTLTPSELALKIQVEDGLKLAQEGSLKNAASAKLAPVGRSPGLTHDTSPCIRAAALTWRKEREIQACKTPSPIPPSCVFTLNYANACLSAANRMLNILAHAPAGEGLFAMATSGAVFENLTSAILLDERVFHVEAPHELYGKLAKQYFLESLGGKSLVEGGGLDNIKKEVLKRLQEQDWESEVAPVVSLTVRYWIFQAHWRFYLYGPTFFSYLLYTRVVEFLEWGRDHWPDSSESVICGGTFREDMFRGVMRLRLQTMQALLGTKPPDDLEHLFTMNDLIADAHELIDATNAHEFPKSSSGLPIGQVAAFWSHTIVHAHGALGWAHFCAGRSGWLDERYKDKACEHFKHASNYYLQAMAGCPKDDPKYAYFVRMQIECRCYGLRPLREILPACTHLLRMVPKALEIWATPHEGGIALVNIKAQVEQFQEWCEKEVTEGRMRVDKTDRFILPTEFVYVDISKAKWPFEPLMWRREREEEEDRGADVESPGHDDET